MAHDYFTLDQLAKCWGLSSYDELRWYWDRGLAVAGDVRTGKPVGVPFKAI